MGIDTFTKRKESTSEGKMPSQKFKYRCKMLLARAYGPRRSLYLLLLLKEICPRKNSNIVAKCY